MNIDNIKSNKFITNILIVFAILVTLNAFSLKYPIYIIIPFLKALFLIFEIFIYGFFFIKIFNKGETGVLESFGTGLIFTTLFFFIISFLKILSAWVIIIFYLIPIIILFFIIKNHKSNFYKTINSFIKRPSLEYLVFIFPLIYASLPSSFYDTLVFHLGIPNLYLQNSGFISTLQFLYANTSIYYEISLIPSVFAGDMVPRFFHFFIGMILIFSIIDFAIKNFKIKKRNILLLTIISMPMSIFLISIVKNDLLSAFFIFIGIKYFLKKRVNISAIFWGFSIGVKYTNIIPLGIFFIAVFIKEKWFDSKKAIIFGLIVLGMLFPLMVKNYNFTNNPVYPFFHNSFKSEFWDSSRSNMMTKDTSKVFHSFKDVIKFPYNISFSQLGSGGIVGALFLIFLPFLILKKEKKYFLLIFSLLTIFLGSFFKMSIRCWYIVFLFLSIYIVIAYESQSKKIMKYIFFTIIFLNFLTSFALMERVFRSHYLISGKFNIEEYKTLLFPTYSAISFINKNSPEGSKILIVGESRNFYLKRAYQVSSPYDYSILKKYLENSNNKKEFISELKKDKINFIIFNMGEFIRLQKDYKRMSKDELKKFSSFIKTLKPIFRKNNLFVFKII